MKKISIIIPTYKRNDYLTRAIDSIIKQEGDYEIIVVDDNDADSIFRKENEKKIKKYIDNYGVIYIKHPNNKNGAAARNTGIKVATSEYITFLDDDDVFTKDRILELQKTIEKYDNPDFICSGIRFKRNGNNLKDRIPNLEVSKKELIFQLLKQESFVGSGSNIVCKREIIDKINGFDEKFSRHQDLEFLIRYLKEAKNYICIPKILIIKNNDDTINIPNFQKFYDMKKLFLEKFQDVIQEYDQQEIDAIYRINYYELLDTAYFLNNKDYIRCAKELLKNLSIYDIKLDCKFYLKNFLKRRKLIIFIRNNIVKFKTRCQE